MKIIDNEDHILVYPFITEEVEVSSNEYIRVNHPKFSASNRKSIEVNFELGIIDRSRWTKICKSMEKAFTLREQRFANIKINSENSYMNEELATKLCTIGRLFGIDNSCTCKSRNKYFFEAAAQAHNHNKSKNPDLHNVSPYPCHFCCGWHVGGTIKPKDIDKLFLEAQKLCI